LACRTRPACILLVVPMIWPLAGCGGSPANNSAPANSGQAANHAASNSQSPTGSAKAGGTSSAAANNSPKSAAKAPPAVKPDAFAQVSDAFDSLVKGMSANDQTAVYTAETWLAMQKDAAVAPLAKIVRDANEPLERRMTACRALGKVGPPAAAALIDCLPVDQERVRLRVIDAMGMVKSGDERLIDKLIELTADGDPQNRQHAIMSLGRTGTAAKKSAPRLVEILNNAAEPEVLRSEAKKALKEVDPRRGLMGMSK
ncbi:MAG: HEAT repeat domain-containing protein, partial [Planctomycetota bacterium]